MEPQNDKPLTIQVASNPTSAELVTLERMAGLLHRSGFCKGARTAEQAVALVLMGREVGLPAMQALSMIHVIDGKPTTSVHLMGALLARGGVSWRPTEHTERACSIEFSRPGWKPIVASFSLVDAARAGLEAKDNWRKWPRNMLYARAFTEGARIIGPDLLCGLSYTPEELAPDLAIDELGTPISMPDNGTPLRPRTTPPPPSVQKVAQPPEQANVPSFTIVDVPAFYEDEPSQDSRDSGPMGAGKAGKLVALAFAREEKMNAEKFACMRAVFHPLGAKSKAQIATLPASKFDTLLAAIGSWDPGRAPGEEG